jgi:pimeloyl-ACP methyl ester carboxylesterase
MQRLTVSRRAWGGRLTGRPVSVSVSALPGKQQKGADGGLLDKSRGRGESRSITNNTSKTVKTGVGRSWYCLNTIKHNVRASSHGGEPSPPMIQDQNGSNNVRLRLVWFKHDLRVDDHPGLHMAYGNSVENSAAMTVPVFVFDPRVYAGMIDCRAMARALVRAVMGLKSNLKERGLDLVVMCGSWEEVLPGIVQGCEGIDKVEVITERECDVRWDQGVERVLASLDDSCEVKYWECLMYEQYSSDVFPEWARGLRGGMVDGQPLDASFMFDNTGDGIIKTHDGLDEEYVWRQVQKVRSEEFFLDVKHVEDDSDGMAMEMCADEETARRYLKEYVSFVGNGESQLSDVTNGMRVAIESYDTDATIDGCFPALFTRALHCTGTLSRRRVHYEAEMRIKELGDAPMLYDKNILSYIGWLLNSHGGDVARARKAQKARAALVGAELSDFHLGQAFSRMGYTIDGAALYHWRWRGMLTDYLYAPPEGVEREGAPAILLVHGFGAFGEHWRRNVKELSDAGFHVYAPTFPGYGRSEKLSLEYGQDLWRDFLCHFISEIITRPVVMAGNSIGGYISASVAGDYPDMVKGLILLNSAGQINPDFSIEEYTNMLNSPKSKKGPPTFIVDSVSSLLFSFLEGDIENQLKRLYPTRPENADEWLSREIRRASNDPQALGVFRSVFYLPPPRPLNYLINKLFRGPVLVLQGALDPLNDAKKRADQIVKACPSARLVLLQAGHCPHDEVPELVNKEIIEFTSQFCSNM